MNIEWLGDQVREILNPQVGIDEEIRSHLVADFCGSRVFDARGCCWGYIWRVIWAIICFFDWNEDCRESALIKAVRSTQEVWLEKKEEIRHHLEVFNHFFEQAIAASFGKMDHSVDEAISIEDVKEAQQKLHDWIFYVGKAFEEEGTGPLEQKIARVHRVFREVLGTEADDDMLDVMHEAYIAHSVLKLQKRMKMDYPLSAITALSSRRQLSVDDQRAMSDFIIRLKTLCDHPDERKRISIRELHRALKVIVEHLDHTVDSMHSLEWPMHQALLDQDCEVFLQRDDEHYRWASCFALQEFAEIECGGEVYTLGEQFTTGKSLEEDQHLVFELNDDEVIVISTRNFTTLKFEWIEAQEKGRGLPMPELRAIDDRWAIYERLSDETVEEYLWSGDSDKWRCLKRTVSLTELVKKMVRERFSIQECSSNTIRFDKNNQLKFVKLPQLGEFNKNDVLNFIRTCCGDCTFTFDRVVATCLAQVK